MALISLALGCVVAVGVASNRPAVAVSAVLLATMWVLGTAVLGGGPPAERLIVGLLVVISSAWISMAQPLVGASIIGHQAVTRPLACLAVVGLGWWRRKELTSITWDPLPALVGIAAGVLLSVPELVTTAGNYPGDMQWHEGWLRQVAGGLLEPTGLYSGVPNDYPWLYHAVGGWVMAVSGQPMSSTLLVLQLAMLATLGLGIWLLSRELGLERIAATWALLFGFVGGGFGWVSQLFAGEFDGHSLVEPPAVPSIYGISPALPRDWGMALVPTALWLLLRGTRASGIGWLAASGAVTGFAFLFAPPAAVAAVAMTVVIGAALRSIRAVIVPPVVTACVSSVWLLPLAWHFHEFGGFIRLSDVKAPGLTAWQAIVQIGAALPLGLAGLVLARRQLDQFARRALMSIVLVPVGFVMLAALVPAGAGFKIPQFESEIRYLPMLVLALAVPAGLAARQITDRLRPVYRPVAVAVIVAASTASTWIAVVYVAHQESARHPAQLLGFACTPHATVQSADTIADIGLNHWVAISAFSATGAYTLFTPSPRIRYRNAFLHTESQTDRRRAVRRIAAGSQPPDVVDWVAVHATRPLHSRFLRTVATCHSNNREITLYRVIRDG